MGIERISARDYYSQRSFRVGKIISLPPALSPYPPPGPFPTGESNCPFFKCTILRGSDRRGNQGGLTAKKCRDLQNVYTAATASICPRYTVGQDWEPYSAPSLTLAQRFSPASTPGRETISTRSGCLIEAVLTHEDAQPFRKFRFPSSRQPQATIVRLSITQVGQFG